VTNVGTGVEAADRAGDANAMTNTAVARETAMASVIVRDRFGILRLKLETMGEPGPSGVGRPPGDELMRISSQD
jgi:hypothetical protein